MVEDKAKTVSIQQGFTAETISERNCDIGINFNERTRSQRNYAYMKPHSLLKVSAGFTNAAFTHWKLIVAMAMKMMPSPTMINVQAGMLSR